MIKSALSALPGEWQTWVGENLARGCEAGSMVTVMVRDGHFDKALAIAAVEEARRALSPHAPAAQPLPDIDTRANTICTPDRLVHVLMTYQAPRIVLLGNVLSEEECDALCAYTEPRLMRSPVVADGAGGTEVHAYRTSQSAMLQRGESELVTRVDERLAALARWPVENGEGLQVVRYEKGNEYKAHYDWFDPALPGPRQHLERGGQRVGTFVLYLNEVEQGGGTFFPNLGLEIQPRKGSAVFFVNTDAYRNPDRSTLHAGMPVQRGIKYIANKWLREREY